MRPLFALFLRSMREDTRAKLPPILRAALVLVILLIIWANQRQFAWRAAPGREFFMMVMMLNTAFVGLMALSIFPSAIAEEKEDDTLTLLRMTNLGPLSILLGKGASRLLAALMLIAVQVPFTLLGVTLGGVTMEQILFSYAILAATTIFTCSVALAASVYCRTTMRAGFLTGTILGVLFFLLPMLAIATALRRMGPATMAATNGFEAICIWIVKSNPVYALAMLFENARVSVKVYEQVWIMLGGSCIFFLIALALFAPCCTNAQDTAGRPRKRKDGKLKPRRFSVGRPGLRPLAWKDWNFMIGGKSGFLLRLGLAAAIFAFAYYFTAYFDTPYNYRNWTQAEYDRRVWRQISEMTIVFTCMCAGLEVLLVSGRIFGAEFRRQTLSSLVGLPWKTGRIIRQKILGCLPVLAPWALLALVGFVVHPDGLLEDLVHEIAKMRADEAALTVYVICQALLLLTTVVWFSLSIRRGALPASIAIIGGWNIVWGIFIDNLNHRSLIPVLIFSDLLTVAALVFMAWAVHRRIQVASSEDS